MPGAAESHGVLLLPGTVFEKAHPRRFRIGFGRRDLTEGLGGGATPIGSSTSSATAPKKLGWVPWVRLDSSPGCHANRELDLCIPEHRRWIAHGMDHFDPLDRR